MNRTPGEWRVAPAEQGEGTFSYVIYSPTYGAVGYWKGRKDAHVNADWCLTEADAHLIAAAPDLLAACEEMEGMLRHDERTYVKEMVIRVNSAIAKARGETR